MIIAFTLIATVLIWFQYGLFYSIFLVVVVTCLTALKSLRMSGVLALSAFLVIVQLEFKLEHPLPSNFQHQTVELQACLDQPLNVYTDDWASGYASVVTQPEALRLRKIKFSFVPSKFESLPTLNQCITGQFRLRQPLGRIIPGSFNADRFNFARHVDAYATLKSIDSTLPSEKTSHTLYLNRADYFFDKNSKDIWSALTLGWHSGMDSSLKETLVENQVIHLFVISGMHLAFIAGFIAILLKLLNRVVSRFVVIPFSVQGLIVIVLTFGYVSLLGFPLPALRAWLTLIIPVVVFFSSLRINPSHQLALVTIVQTLLFPEGWLSLGPWLTYSALVVIFLIYRWRVLASLSWFGKFVGFQAILSLSILPWAVLSGLPINPFSIGVNAVLTLVVGFVLLPFAFFILLFPLDKPIFIWEAVTQYLIKFLKFGQVWAFELPGIPGLTLVGCSLLMAFVLWERSKLAMMLALWAGLLIVLAPVAPQKSTVDSRITLLDVGHGQAVLIESPSETVLYDTGGFFSPEVSLYEATLHRVVPNLDAVVISHSDTDHAAGFKFIRDQSPSLQIYSGEASKLAYSETVYNCHRQNLNSEYMRFIPVPVQLQTNDNNASCVLVFEDNDKSLIITGDASKHIEYFLLQEHPELFPVDLLILGHHGSQTSSAKDWLNANIDAFFAVSASNRAAPKWPAEGIQQWFVENEITLYNTAQVGSIEFKILNDEIRVKTWDSAYRNRLIH